MKPLAIRIQYPEAYAVAVTSQMSVTCTPPRSRPQPKIHMPRKVDSAKKAMRVSNASGAPKTLPANLLRPLQLSPNWNSMTRPVTMPTA